MVILATCTKERETRRRVSICERKESVETNREAYLDRRFDMSHVTHLSKVNVQEKASLFSAHWTPKIIGELNGQHVKLAKLIGEFGWHSHEKEDELFLVLKGQVIIQLRNNEQGDIVLNEGEMFIVPRGVEHNPKADKGECTVLLFEPASTVNTGEERNDKTQLELEHLWIRFSVVFARVEIKKKRFCRRATSLTREARRPLRTVGWMASAASIHRISVRQFLFHFSLGLSFIPLDIHSHQRSVFAMATSNDSNLSDQPIGKSPWESSVLVVGAGGIGCELLKSLALCRFRSIAVIDLDTIEVSNLNRQFLFRREHVGQPKATVACETIRRLCPSIAIEPFHGDVITDARFDVSFYKRFDLVINALDNVQARQHVNRMCLLCSKPLIDSGSTGYNGQATLIFKGRTQCYDCIEKPKQQRTYAVCTIRNTPSQPIHCIVWAKFLYNQLFGDNDDPNNEDVTPDADDPENQSSEQEAPTTTNGHHRVSTRDWIHSELEEFDPVRVFNKLFFDDIHYLTSMKNLWEKRRQPTPIDHEKAAQIKEIYQNGQGDHEPSAMPKLNDQRIQAVSDYVQMFLDSLNELKQRSDKQRHLGRIDSRCSSSSLRLF